jgi:hypothetical protein
VVITIREEVTLIGDLRETFDNLDRYKMKLNPTKCSFGVPAGQLLGFLVSAIGIEANTGKIQAILKLAKPTKLHEIQQLAGQVAALSRFIARLREKALPFYTLMKKSDKKFEWTEEADKRFLTSKKCSPCRQCWSHPMRKSHCYYTLQPHIRWLARYSLSSGAKKEKLMEFSDPFIFYAKYSHHLSSATRIIKSLHTTYS